MLLNNSWESSGGSSGGDITVVGSTSNMKSSITEMNNIPSPKSGDLCYVINGGLYMHNGTSWEIIPTGDMFYNKLASTTDVGHVKLTSDITLDSEDVAITPKALKQAIEEALINENDTQWDDLGDGVDDANSDIEWGNW